MRTTEEHFITWEVDGGNYSKMEEAVLFEGRLYSSRGQLIFAKTKSQMRGFARVLSALMMFAVAISGSRS